MDNLGPSLHEEKDGARNKRNRWILLTAVVAITSLMVVGYAASLLNVSNTATIQAGASLVATGPVAQGTDCTGSTGTYTNSVIIAWGSVPTGTQQARFICVENMGTGSYQVSISSDLPPSDGSISTPQSGQMLAPGLFLLVELDWSVSAGAPLGGVSFNITFQ